MVKNSWKFAHTLEPTAIRTAEAGTWAWHRGSTAPPGTPSENLMNSSHILARIHMKLGTRIDLIELNNFCVTCHGNAQQEVGYSGLFKKHMLWNLKYSSRIFNRRAPNPVNVIKTLGMLNCGGIFDISNGLPVARRLIKSTYIVWFWSDFSGLFGVWSRSHRCDNYEAKL